MASTGHISFDSRQSFFSSGVVGCLLTNEYALSLLRPKLFGAVALHRSQSIHSAQSTKYFPITFSGALFFMSAIRRFLTTRCCTTSGVPSSWRHRVNFTVWFHLLRSAHHSWQSLIRYCLLRLCFRYPPSFPFSTALLYFSIAQSHSCRHRF